MASARAPLQASEHVLQRHIALAPFVSRMQHRCSPARRLRSSVGGLAPPQQLRTLSLQLPHLMAGGSHGTGMAGGSHGTGRSAGEQGRRLTCDCSGRGCTPAPSDCRFQPQAAAEERGREESDRAKSHSSSSTAPERHERPRRPRPAAPGATVSTSRQTPAASCAQQHPTCSRSSCLSVCRSVACILPAQSAQAPSPNETLPPCPLSPASRLASAASSSSARTCTPSNSCNGPAHARQKHLTLRGCHHSPALGGDAAGGGGGGGMLA